MSVAAHLGLEPAEYDQQILTLIPFYDEILDASARALTGLGRPGKTLLDLGTGSGALAARCLTRLKGARVFGIDNDPAMLGVARRRLGRRLTPLVGAFETTPFPSCDVVTASFALHHVASPRTKARVFRRAFAALRPGGMLVDADSMIADDPQRQALDYRAWRDHLATTYGAVGARRHLASWADEDTYLPLSLELTLMRRAGFTVDVVWRKGAFAVVAATKRR